jgi:hypothetical protein
MSPERSVTYVSERTNELSRITSCPPSPLSVRYFSARAGSVPGCDDGEGLKLELPIAQSAFSPLRSAAWLKIAVGIAPPQPCDPADCINRPPQAQPHRDGTRREKKTNCPHFSGLASSNSAGLYLSGGTSRTSILLRIVPSRFATGNKSPLWVRSDFSVALRHRLHWNLDGWDPGHVVEWRDSAGLAWPEAESGGFGVFTMPGTG